MSTFGSTAFFHDNFILLQLHNPELAKKKGDKYHHSGTVRRWKG